jgi:TP901 family phage tail tape measure protein
MAEKIVKGIDIVEKGALSEHIEQAKQLLVVYKQLDDEVKSTAESLSKMSKGFKATKTGDIGTAKATSDNMNKAMIEQERLEQARIRTKKALLQLEKAQEQQANKTAKAIKDEGNAYKQQSKTLTDLINRYQNLAARGRENGKVAKGMLAEINKLDAGLKKIDATVGRHQRNVGNYTSALDKLKGAGLKVSNMLGQLGLAMGVGVIVKGATDTIIEFDSAIADLSAITGASGKDLDFFKENAIRMGVDVKGGAAAVVEAYKLIASAKPELLENAAALNSVTEATILLSRASGMELPDAATALTDAMNQFGAGAEQAGKFVDVLAAGAKFGSAEIPQITEALLKFGAVAKTTNVNIQESTGLIEALAEKGLKGAEAGTALRNVMLKLSAPDALPKEAQDRLAALGVNFDALKDKSKPFAERLEALKPLLTDNGALIKVFGTENAVAATTLLSSTDRIKELTASVNENGVALDQANVRSSTISSAFNRLKETINGVILSFVNGKGAASGFVSILDFMTRNIKTILTVVYQLGKAFLIYKTTMLAINSISKASILIEKLRTDGLKSMFIQQTAVNGATEKGTGAVKLFGKTMNAVPIALLVTGLTILVTELLNMESASAAAARALDEVTESTKLLNEEILAAIENTKTQYQDNITQRIETLKNAGKTEKEIQEDITSNYIVELEKRKKSLEEILAPETGVSMMTMDVLAQNFQQGQQIPLDNPMGINPNQKTKYQAVVDEARNERIAAFKKELDEINLLLQSEQAREESSKKMIDNYKEVNVIEGKINSNREKSKVELSEMAKLEKELQEMQLKRSNLIIRQKGEESDVTLELKKQEQFLKNKIQYYKDLLDNKEEHEEDVRQLINPDDYGWRGETDLIDLQEEMNAEYDAIARENEGLADIEEQRIADQIQLAQDLTDIATFLTDKRIEAIDREIEAEKRKYDESKQNIDAIIAMREMDSNSMAQSIAFEKAEQAKALAAQEKLQRKKQRLELLNTSIGMLNAQIAAGNGDPLAKTMVDITTLIGFIKSIPMFWEGTDTTVGDSVGSKFSNGRDGILARVDKSEMILNKSKVDKLAAMGIHSTDEVVKRLMLGNGINNVPTSMVAMNDNSDVVNELAEHRALLKQLVNKPVTNTTLEQVGKVVKMIETVNKPHRNIVTVKQKRIS